MLVGLIFYTAFSRERTVGIADATHSRDTQPFVYQPLKGVASHGADSEGHRLNDCDSIIYESLPRT